MTRLFPGTDEDFDDLDPASAQETVANLQTEWSACDAAVDGITGR